MDREHYRRPYVSPLGFLLLFALNVLVRVASAWISSTFEEEIDELRGLLGFETSMTQTVDDEPRDATAHIEGEIGGNDETALAGDTASSGGEFTGSEFPGGGLEAHEAAGGHTIERHVGRTVEQLEDRLADQRSIPAASTFYDLETAERAIAEVLDQNDDQITQWLASGGDNSGSSFTATLHYTVGIVLERGVGEPYDSDRVRVVLRPEPGIPGGYRVHTAYPEAP